VVDGAADEDEEDPLAEGTAEAEGDAIAEKVVAEDDDKGEEDDDDDEVGDDEDEEDADGPAEITTAAPGIGMFPDFTTP
jgi:hypothetical protein